MEVHRGKGTHPRSHSYWEREQCPNTSYPIPDLETTDTALSCWLPLPLGSSTSSLTSPAAGDISLPQGAPALAMVHSTLYYTPERTLVPSGQRMWDQSPGSGQRECG